MTPRGLIQNWIYWHGKIWGAIYFDILKEFPNGHAITTTTVIGQMDENGIIKTSNHAYILGIRAEKMDDERNRFRPVDSKD